VYDQKVNGAVKKKYTDSSNHNYQKIIYSSENNIEGEMIFTPELEDMYEFLNIGDSIIKEKNSVYYRVKSKSTGKDTVFKFVNSCKDTISNLK
jgi:hypothetical protein